MKTKFKHTIFLIILVFSVLNSSSCSNREDTINCFPRSPINVTLNLNLPAYFSLQNVGGWIYVDEQQAGTRGLIIVRSTSGFLVFDRNAPHICPDNTTTLAVEGNIKIICPKDGAEWILITGQPTKISQIPPKTYPYSYESNSKILSIFY